MENDQKTEYQNVELLDIEKWLGAIKVLKKNDERIFRHVIAIEFFLFGYLSYLLW